MVGVITELRPAAAASGPLAACTAAVEMAPDQSGSSGGIHLVLHVANAGADAVDLFNPLDFLAAGILLYDKAGLRVQLPPAVPRVLVHGAGPDRGRLSLPFGLDFVELGGRPLSDSEIHARVLHLPPGARLRIGIALNQSAPPAAVDGASPAPVPLAPGEYRIEVSVTLATPAAPESPIVLQSPELSVRYGTS